ncbi:MAG: hypothetical protein J5I90_11535 [Caldilineales bacterium]|nr:hypothetical protein [Caldilineales bacterium]
MKLTDIIGRLPYRMAFAGGWIDQPYVSQYNPNPPGSMVVVAIEPTSRFMDRCGMGTSTRKVAAALWPHGLPEGDPARLTRQLYEAENRGRPEPSGSQDMAGLIYPGINRLDYDFEIEGGYFPAHVESCQSPAVARWLEQVITMVPVAQRPDGYNPLEIKNLDPAWIARLGQSGRDCYDAIVHMDAEALGASFNESMMCWETILPHTVRHSTIAVDLMGILGYYQSRYTGAMYSGCGGGYIYVVSEEPVPGGFQVKVRLDHTSQAR